jgi:predicted nuclease of predicted toxin-antitoxin system
MYFLVDAQLPPALAEWLSTQGHGAAHVCDAVGAHATDRAIVAFAVWHGAVIVTKDFDFLDLISRPPPRILHVATGNLSNRALLARFEAQFANAAAQLADGRAVATIS